MPVFPIVAPTIAISTVPFGEKPTDGESLFVERLRVCRDSAALSRQVANLNEGIPAIVEAGFVAWTVAETTAIHFETLTQSPYRPVTFGRRL